MRGLEVAMAQSFPVQSFPIKSLPVEGLPIEASPINSVRIDRTEEQLLEARTRVEEQKTKLQRLIVQGAPTQAAEDLLCRLHKAMQRITEHARCCK
jgi:hypothetical protein